MTRPIYEQEKDRQAQAEVAAYLCWLARGSKMFGAPALCPYDFIIKSPSGGERIVEVKRRYNRSDLYPTLIISKRKTDENIGAAKVRGCGYTMAVQWDDRLGVVRPGKLPLAEYECIGGRTDRADRKDIEPVYAIPMECFQMLDRVPDELLIECVPMMDAALKGGTLPERPIDAPEPDPETVGTARRLLDG
jgi:hypothetical protein